MLTPPRTVVHRGFGLYALERTLQRRGFASVAAGNLLTEDDQWRKLALVVETADEVWP